PTPTADNPLRPLDGTRVVSTAGNIPGPVAAARLRDLGAHVVKVEPPGGDPLRTSSPAAYEELTAGQEVVTLDLRAPGEAQVFWRLLAEAELLVTASRSASLARLGIDWQSVHSKVPRTSVVAFVGSAAPDGGAAGHDLTYQAASGTLTAPDLPKLLVADFAGAERAVSEALVALLVQRSTGQGCYREVVLAEAAASMARPLRWGLTTPDGPLGGALPAYRLYAAQDGFVALAALEPHFLRRTLELLAIDGSADAFEAVFRTRTSAEWERWAKEHDVPLAEVRGATEYRS
ncbi:MAG: CoA transferase, partial [Actinomycetota bacterium]|nr:CoA transferase [Actinomycetota bacterium]